MTVAEVDIRKDLGRDVKLRANVLAFSKVHSEKKSEMVGEIRQQIARALGIPLAATSIFSHRLDIESLSKLMLTKMTSETEQLISTKEFYSRLCFFGEKSIIEEVRFLLFLMKESTDKENILAEAISKISRLLGIDLSIISMSELQDLMKDLHSELLESDAALKFQHLRMNFINSFLQFCRFVCSENIRYILGSEKIDKKLNHYIQLHAELSELLRCIQDENNIILGLIAFHQQKQKQAK